MNIFKLIKSLLGLKNKVEDLAPETAVFTETVAPKKKRKYYKKKKSAKKQDAGSQQ